MSMGIFMGIPIPMGWENFFSSGNPYTNLHGNLVGILIGIPQDSYGNGLGMGTEIPLPRKPC